MITNAPDLAGVNEVLSSEEAGVFSDHDVVAFDFTAFIKAPSKFQCYVFDYAKADFDGLCASLNAVRLFTGIDVTDWQIWKDKFLAAIADYVPTKRLKGCNPIPWINGAITSSRKKNQFEGG